MESTLVKQSKMVSTLQIWIDSIPIFKFEIMGVITVSMHRNVLKYIEMNLVVITSAKRLNSINIENTFVVIADVSLEDILPDLEQYLTKL